MSTPAQVMPVVLRHRCVFDLEDGKQTQTEFGFTLIFPGDVRDATAPRDEDRASRRFNDVFASKLSDFKQGCMDKDSFSWASNHEWWVYVPEEYEGDTINPNDICECDWKNAEEVIWYNPSFVFHEILIKVPGRTPTMSSISALCFITTVSGLFQIWIKVVRPLSL